VKLGHDIDITIRHSARSKYVRIRITPIKGVELVIPTKYNLKKAYDFLSSKELWIRNKLSRISVNEPANENQIPIYGELHTVIFSSERIPSLIKIEQGSILVSSQLTRADLPLMLGAILKTILKKDIEEYAGQICSQLKTKHKKIFLKDTKNQWGSCSYTGNLSFSWRLIFAPRFVMEYLVVHEVCHLIERNHSSRFWKLVGQVYPKYNLAKSWLRKNGSSLHQILK
jgi:predicted metal-dependent hydrolase